jgi:hypothetical protein
MKNRPFNAFLEVHFLALYCFILTGITVAQLPSFRLVAESAYQGHVPMIGIKPHYEKAGYVDNGYGTIACTDPEFPILMRDAGKYVYCNKSYYNRNFILILYLS